MSMTRTRIWSPICRTSSTFGAFVNLKPGTDGLLHISRIAKERIAKVEDVLQLGDQVLVRVIDIDAKTGKISLTRKDLLPDDKSK